MSKKKLRWKIVNALPKTIRYQIIRKMFKANYELSSDYIFKIAETRQEIEQAFSVLYDSYVEQGLMDTNETKIRVTKYHAMPSTTMLIVKYKDEVIATMSAIGDSPLGLPLESCWDISSLREKKLKLLEVGALAIKSGHRNKQGKILLPLCKFMMLYTYHYAKVDGAIISINAKVKDFYNAILLFRAYEGSGKKEYGFVKGDVGDSVWLPFKTLPEDFKKIYAKNPRETNMYHYIWEYQQDNFIFPENKYFKTSYPVLSPYLLDHFFRKKSHVFTSMNEKERLELKRVYFYQDFSHAIDSKDYVTERRYARFAVHCPASSGVIKEVSRRGFALDKLTENYALGTIVMLNVNLGPGIKATLNAKVLWLRDEKAGFEILKDVLPWTEFINYLEAELLKKPLEIAA